MNYIMLIYCLLDDYIDSVESVQCTLHEALEKIDQELVFASEDGGSISSHSSTVSYILLHIVLIEIIRMCDVEVSMSSVLRL